MKRKKTDVRPGIDIA